MTTSTMEYGKVTVIECQGNLNALSMVVLKNKMRRLMEKNRKKVVLDLSQTKQADMAGIGILVERIKEARSENGDIKLCGLQPAVKKAFRLVGVSKLIDTFSNQKDAIRSFQLA